MNDELALLRRANPVSPSRWPAELDTRARSELTDILSASRRGQRQRRRWTGPAALVAACAAVVVALSLTGGPSTQPGLSATPPLLVFSPMKGAAGAVLDDLATTAAHSPGSDKTNSQVVRTQGWSLFTRVDGKVVTSAVVPVTSELRWNPDRSGSLNRVFAQPYFPTPEDRKAWEDAGRPGKTGTSQSSATFAPGQYRPMWDSEPPTQTNAMARYLSIGHPITSLGTGELFIAVADLARERNLTPAQRAAVLRVLAQAPDTIQLGTVQDRLGRTGIAIASDSNYSGLMTRYILIFDPDSGALNAQEEWLTKTSGALNVPIPSVISYTAWRH